MIRFSRRFSAVVVAVLAGAANSQSEAALSGPFPGVTVFAGDPEGWAAAAGDHHRIEFDETGVAGLLTTQYAEFGVTVDPSQSVFIQEIDGFDDGWGIANGALLGGFLLDFDGPRNAFAFESTDHSHLTFFLGQQEVGSIPALTTDFAGFTTEFEFDRVAVTGGAFQVLDDIYVQQIVPGPGGAISVLVGLIAGRGRRRRP